MNKGKPVTGIRGLQPTHKVDPLTAAQLKTLARLRASLSQPVQVARIPDAPLIEHRRTVLWIADLHLEPVKHAGTAPPSDGVFLLYLFLSKKDRAEMVGDLQEQYPTVLAEFGERRANIWFWKQIVCTIYPVIEEGVSKRLTKLLGLLKIVALIWSKIA